MSKLFLSGMFNGLSFTQNLRTFSSSLSRLEQASEAYEYKKLIEYFDEQFGQIDQSDIRPLVEYYGVTEFVSGVKARYACVDEISFPQMWQIARAKSVWYSKGLLYHLLNFECGRQVCSPGQYEFLFCLMSSVLELERWFDVVEGSLSGEYMFISVLIG